MKVMTKQKMIYKKSSKHTKQLSKFKKQFLEYYSKLPIQKLAAEFIGKHEDTITDWKKKDKRFSDQVASAKSEWALENVKQVKSKEWLLERVMRDHFGENVKAEHSVNQELEAALERMRQIVPKADI